MPGTFFTPSQVLKIIIFDTLLRTKYVLIQIRIGTKHDREKSRNSISFDSLHILGREFIYHASSIFSVVTTSVPC